MYIFNMYVYFGVGTYLSYAQAPHINYWRKRRSCLMVGVLRSTYVSHVNADEIAGSLPQPILPSVKKSTAI